MKRTAPHPSLEEQCSPQKGRLPGGSGMYDSCFRTCWGPAQQPRTQEGPGPSLELIPDATLPAVHLSPLTTEFTFTHTHMTGYMGRMECRDKALSPVQGNSQHNHR